MVEDDHPARGEEMADYRISDLVEKLTSGELSRRQFIARASAAGLGGAAIAAGIAHTAKAAPAGGVRRGFSTNQVDANTLVVADALNGGAWLTADPAWFYEISSAAMMNLVYECLYHVPDGANAANIQPLLAEGMPEFSADGLTVTVKIKQGVKFHTTGNIMTAADWVFSFNRCKNIGYQPSFLAIDYWTEVQAIDDATLQFTLAAPNAALAAVLTSLPLAVTDSKAVIAAGGTDAPVSVVPEEGSDEKAPEVEANEAAKAIIDNASVGTGPYIMVQWDVDNECIVEANPAYWGTPPKLERIIWRNILEPNAQLQSVQIGEADLAYALQVDQIETVTSDPNLQLISGDTLAIEYVGMNITEERGGALAKKEVRQALAHAIDYDGIINSLLAGSASRPATAVPLPLTGSPEVLELAYTLDLAKAQGLWDASGVGEAEIEFIYDSDSPAQGNVNLESLATKIKSDLEQINGCTIKLSPMPGAERIALYRAGDFQATISPWTPDYPDVDSYAGPFARTGVAAAKRVGYSDPAVDALLDQGLSETDPAKRTEIYVEIQKAMIDACAFIVLYQPKDNKPASVKVSGVTTHSVYQMQMRDADKAE
jgi:peptide/nickel transport system substrate-binding protein